MWADGVRRPIAIAVAAPACAQDGGGGVVRMNDGAVTFKGGAISNSKAAVRPARVARPRAMIWYVARCGTADGWRARCGARMLRRVVYGVRPHAAGVERALYVSSSCRIDACCIGASARVASVRVARCVGVRGMLQRRVLHWCIGDAQPSRSEQSGRPLCSVCCAGADRLGEGRAVRAAARCTRVQTDGGVLFMITGTALFDSVAISGTEAIVQHYLLAIVRAALGRRCAHGAGVGGRDATADCNGRGCAGLCAGRRRGAHERWGRHVQGRRDLELQGGACTQRESRVPAPWYGVLRGAARPMDGAHGAAHARCG